MDKIDEIQNKIFLECQTILKNIAKIETKEELLSKQNLIYEITERISFLKLLEHNNLPSILNEISESSIMASDEIVFSNSESVDETIEEKIVVFTNELNNIEEYSDNQEIKTENIIGIPVVNETEIIVSQEIEYILQDEAKIENEEFSSERKIKLASIKGIRPQSLFDEELLNELTEEETSSIKMEQSTQRTEFKLDLNDRIAFSKMLFNGSQLELNEIIKTLNSFNTLEEAKEYLSDMYYDRNWSKVDEYAQRLWTLVESKFL